METKFPSENIVDLKRSIARYIPDDWFLKGVHARSLYIVEVPALYYPARNVVSAGIVPTSNYIPSGVREDSASHNVQAWESDQAQHPAFVVDHCSQLCSWYDSTLRLTPWRWVPLEKPHVAQPYILQSPKVHCRVHKSPPLVPILNQINPGYIISLRFI
jgi:hypothetical protein